MTDDPATRLLVSDLALIVSYLTAELHRRALLSPEATGPIVAALDQLAAGLEPADPDGDYELAETAAVLHSVALLLRRDLPGPEP